MNTVVNYEDRLVVFIDVLGFKDHLKKTVDQNNQDSTDNIKILIRVYDIIKHHLVTDNSETLEKNITIFSDCIVLSIVPKNDNVLIILQSIKDMIISLIGINILCRGGVSYGKIIHNDNYVFGPALVESYTLEDKVANNPRIILHSSVVHHINNRTNGDKDILTRTLLTKDFDGYYYIDYFNKHTNDEFKYNQSHLETLYKIKKIVVDNFKKYNRPEQVAIRAKFNWMNEKLTNVLHAIYSDRSAPFDNELAEYELDTVVKDELVPDLVFKSGNEFKLKNSNKTDNIFGLLNNFLFKPSINYYEILEDACFDYKDTDKKYYPVRGILDRNILFDKEHKSKYHK